MNTNFTRAYNKAYMNKAQNTDSNVLTNSNKKVKAYLFSLPPVQSCLNHKSCASTCYAVKSYRQYPSCKALWDYNYTLARTNLKELYRRLDNELSKIDKSKGSIKTIRIHQSGDFISDAYIDIWYNLAIKYPNLTFYGYTKVDKLLNVDKLNTLHNVNIIKSVLNGKRNYGSVSYVKKLVKDEGAVICDATYGEDKDTVKCGVTCNKCMVPGTKVVFVQH